MDPRSPAEKGRQFKLVRQRGGERKREHNTTEEGTAEASFVLQTALSQLKEKASAGPKGRKRGGERGKK